MATEPFVGFAGDANSLTQPPSDAPAKPVVRTTYFPAAQNEGDSPRPARDGLASASASASAPDSAIGAPHFGALPNGRVNGRAAFQQLIRDVFATAAAQSWHEIIVSDGSFFDWPLGDREVAESLTAWAKSGHHFVMLAPRYDDLARTHARFGSWRRQWSHLVDCRVCTGVDPQDFPSAIWSPHWAMRRLDPVHSVCVCGSEPERRVLLREELDERRRHSAPGFAASILGL